MSTKTSIKRIALVAVSALGFGLFSTVTSNAAPTGAGGVTVNSTVVLTNSTTTVAGRVGQRVTIGLTATGSAAGGGASNVINAMRFAAAITSQPASSTVYANLAAGSVKLAQISSDKGFEFFDKSLSVSTGSGVAINGDLAARTSTADATAPASILYVSENGDGSGEGATAAFTNLAVGDFYFTPTVAGTYTATVWVESTATGIAALSGAESFKTFTINVGASVASTKLTAINSTASVSGSNGALVKVNLYDAAGNAAVLSAGETVTLTPSGSAVIAKVNGNSASSTTGQAWNLSAANFTSSGEAWINVTNGSAEDINVTASVNGGANSSIALSFKTTTATAAAAAPYPYQLTRTAYLASGSATSIPLSATHSLTFRLAGGSATWSNFTVTESVCATSGLTAITGRTAALVYDQAAQGSATTGIASITVTGGCTTNGEQAYTVIESGSKTNTVTSVTRTAGVLTATPANINAVAGSSNTINISLKDNFGAAYANQTVSATVAGKNPVTTARIAVTDASGLASFTFTDANTNSAVNDVVTLTSGSSVTSTISYGTNTVSKVTLEYPNEDDVVAGTTFTEISAAGAGATGTSAAVTAIVTGSTGALLAGVPVTFSVSGLTGAEVHTTLVTVYTGTDGKASTAISSYAAGKATVTATAGGVSSSADIYFKQTGATEARTIAAAVSGNVVTATVKDRYGNTIEGVTINATRTGTGYFGSGASTATGNTDKNGQVEFIFTGTGTVTVAFTAADYGQSADKAGFVGATAVTASAAGTTTTNQTGLGAALAPAGVNSASVSVTSVDPAAAAAEAASDAALEAIDAANAATDAANLAAEAADAATVAAEEARDAADAATAAVEALASEVATLIAGLKAQITTLANTVAKIAKRVRA